MAHILERYGHLIKGVIGCYDRVVITGTLPGICFADGMTSLLNSRGIRIFDYTKWAEPLRDSIRNNAESIAASEGLEIEFIRKLRGFRKEERVKKILDQRGEHPGLVHIFSAMEACSSYRPWHDKKTGRSFLKPAPGKCLHYYFYFVDPELGLSYVRVPTWGPFRLQVYFNAHNWLACRLQHAAVGFTMLDNAFSHIDDFERAQQLSDAFDVARLHERLDEFARRYCPVHDAVQTDYHWSLLQVEYATDLVFRNRTDLAPIYETLVRTAVHSVKPEHIATFLGRRLHSNFTDEIGNDLSVRIEGTRIRHQMGPAAIKMYDKRGIILRIETTANDVSFFKHHRKVEQTDGTTKFKLAPVRRTIYSLFPDLRELLAAANRRYLEFLSALDDPSSGIRALEKTTQPASDNGRTHRGLNFFAPPDQQLLQVLGRGDVAVAGVRNRDLREHIDGLSTWSASTSLKRLRTHGLIKKVAHTYKYYLTELGRRVVLAGLKLKQLVLIPELAKPFGQPIAP